ncbi:transposase [Novosphingobium sp. ES2-1]|uniref:transposase n=1 Tax=Novosphingobium TaxID=165696 RepID=UPI00187FD4F0|nr:transposase [Novosphingobium sp. ES2-1]
MTDRGYSIIELSLPNKPRRVPGVDHRRFLNGTAARLRPASSRPDGPPRHGSSTTCCNRFVRWRQAGVHNRFWLLFPRLSKADCVAGLRLGPRPPAQCDG